MTGRKPADPAARLSLLRAARENAKPDDILSGQTEMAPLLGMSWRNLTKTIDADPDFPVLTRGGEGVPWQFNAVAVIDHLIAKCEAALAERTARAGKMERLSGLRLQSSDDKPAKGRRRAAAAPPPAEAPMSSTELREIGQAQLTAHRLKELQGKLVVADPMKRFLADYHSTMQGETLGLLGKIDPGGQLPPAVRLNIEDSMRTLLVNLQSRMDRFLAGYSDRSAA